jgi:SAM-dependent methyltransferase
MKQISKTRPAVILGIASLLVGLVAWRTSRWLRAARRTGDPAESLDLLETNRKFYDELWSEARLVNPRRFNTWPLVRRLLVENPSRLEVGPGLRPRLPIAGTDFIDASEPAVKALQARQGSAQTGIVSALPFANDRFDLVCALDIVEHAEDDGAALAELARVTKTGGIFLLSVPLYADRWTKFDEFVGHGRRYEPAELVEQLARHGFAIEWSAAYGMQPRSPWLSDFGMRCLLQRRKRAMWYYTHLFMPIGLWFQPRLRFVAGMISGPKIDEILLVCRKRER